jgi:hypothetical protein
LPGNLPQPLALRYHGHQFRVYNPDIGDGRGFLFAQMRDGTGRLLDLGTKGSGQTPYSRDGDGRLTLKGAVREILATEMLEALGVNTSKTFSVIETGEQCGAATSPRPPARQCWCASRHGHIRIGSFQRLPRLRGSCATWPRWSTIAWPPIPARPRPRMRRPRRARRGAAAPGGGAAGAPFGQLHGGRLRPRRAQHRQHEHFGRIASIMARGAGCHSGIRPSPPPISTTPGLYAFGRQPAAIQWNCAQLAMALRPLVSGDDPVVAAIDRFGGIYREAMARRISCGGWASHRRAQTHDAADRRGRAVHAWKATNRPGPFFFRSSRRSRPPGKATWPALLAACTRCGRFTMTRSGTDERRHLW